MKRLPLIIAMCVLVLGVAPAPAQTLTEVKQRIAERMPQLATLKKQKIVGEDAAGYVQIVPQATADETARTLVKSENADRKVVYAAIAATMKASTEAVGAQRAKQIHEQAAPGIMLQAANGTWSEKK